MALVKCSECGKQVSSAAAACPNCGAKPKKRTSLFTWIVTAFIGFAALSALFSEPSEKSAASRPAPKVKSPEELRYEKNLNRAAVAAQALRKSMRNPDSFVLEQALAMESNTICIEYRAQNGFGGMNRGRALLSADDKKLLSDESDGFNSSWNKSCAGQTGDDLTRAVQVYL